MLVDLKSKISLKEQHALLKKCMEKNLDLSFELAKLGLNYDFLRYRNYSNERHQATSKYQTIENLKQPDRRIPAISFFSGAGGLNIGFEYAGFKNIASIEINELFCETLRLNNPDHCVIGPPDFSGNIKEREDIANILQKLVGIKSPFEGVFHGGPPCQPFSIASNQRFAKEDDNFKRTGFFDKEKGDLLNDYIWFISYFKPKAFIIENVPGLQEMDQGKKLRQSLNKLAKLGYKISEPTVINSAEYGVPQKRLRLIIVGTRSKKEYQFPKPNPYLTACFDVFEKSIADTENHLTRDHSVQSVLRYMELNYGQRDPLGRVDRLNPFLPSKTVIAGGTKGGGRSHLHPYSPRTLSVRESARLQTFPDDYVFSGPVARQFTQVGNAVPPVLALKLALEIYNQFYR